MIVVIINFNFKTILVWCARITEMLSVVVTVVVFFSIRIYELWTTTWVLLKYVIVVSIVALIIMIVVFVIAIINYDDVVVADTPWYFCCYY